VRLNGATESGTLRLFDSTHSAVKFGSRVAGATRVAQANLRGKVLREVFRQVWPYVRRGLTTEVLRYLESRERDPELADFEKQLDRAIERDKKDSKGIERAHDMDDADKWSRTA
jgi:hypothetical protein